MLFLKDADFQAFVNLMADAFARFDVDPLVFCLMGNHWHMLLRPRTDGALSRCMAWLTVTHARRHHRHYPNPGHGHLYQGRFKSFPVQSDEHFLAVARYIHANPVRAGLTGAVENWRWNDLHGSLAVAEWPVPRPEDWTSQVNAQADERELQTIRNSLRRGSPLGSAPWVKRTADRLGLISALRPLGRPKRPLLTLSARQRRRREREENGH